MTALPDPSGRAGATADCGTFNLTAAEYLNGSWNSRQ